MDKLLKNEVVEVNKRGYETARLSRSHGIPEGAVRMSKDDVLKMQLKRLQDWSPQSDLWSFKHGSTISASSAAISGILINMHFRNKFVLMNYGRLGTFFPCVVIPAVMTVLVSKLMTTKVLLEPQCPTCIETRSGVLHSISSVLYASVVSPLLCIGFSRKYHTYLLKNNFQPGVIHALKSSQLARNCFVLLLAANFGVGFFVTYQQGRALEKVEMGEVVMVAKQALEEQYNTAK